MKTKEAGIISIACMGAIRPMKNQLIQAMAAMRFADELGKKLKFHVNYARLEQNGENVYKNIKYMFEGSDHEFVEHGWLSHKEFMSLIRSMDMGLQVSFSETFNIVAADFVNFGIPIVVSKEIEWMNFLYKADSTDIDSIISHMWLAWYGKKWNLHRLNKWGLYFYNKRAIRAWRDFLKREKIE